VPEARVLDLFAGSGALSLEALSRGAAHATLVDIDRAAIRCIQQNVTALRFTEETRILPMDWKAAVSQLQREGAQFDLIFLDPPYQSDLLENCIQAVAKFDILSEHGIMICESALEKPLPEVAAPYEKGREYRYGKIKLTVYRRQGSEEL